MLKAALIKFGWEVYIDLYILDKKETEATDYVIYKTNSNFLKSVSFLWL
jgi:hypothetical protein